MDINFELYKVFYYVAGSLSFSEASRRLGISQPAVSQSIKTLEKKLGQPLFARSTKQVGLTPAGKLLFEHIEPAMNLIRRGENYLLDAKGFGAGQLHIAANDTICRYFLVPYLRQFHRRFPDVPIKVTNATSPECARLLVQGKVDLIFTNFPNSGLDASCTKKIVGSFTDVFIANPVYFNLRQQEITFRELQQYPILMLDKKSSTSEFLHKLFLEYQLRLSPQIELSSNDLLIDLARIGLGIAFVPDYCLERDCADLLIVRTKEKLPPRQIVAATNPAFPGSQPIDEFLRLFTDSAPIGQISVQSNAPLHKNSFMKRR